MIDLLSTAARMGDSKDRFSLPDLKGLLKSARKFIVTAALSASLAFPSVGALARDQSGSFTGLIGFMAYGDGTVGTPSPAASSYIVSIQQFSITIASGSTTGTATISSVTTNNAVIIFGGTIGSSATTSARDYAYLTLTNATTVTATRNSGTSSTCTVNGTVVEFVSGAVNVAAQYGTITLSGVTSNTATITSVDTTKAAIFYLGLSTSNSGMSTSVYTNVELTNGTTVTASRTGSTGTNIISFCVLEFTTTVMKTVQQRSVSLSTNATAPTDTITSVTANNTILLYGGTDSAVSAPSDAMHYLTLTNGTTVTLTRTGNSTSTRIIKYCVLEFQSGILNSAVQRSTILMAAAASNTATITSVSTSKSFVSSCNFDTDISSTTVIDRVLPECTLTDATTVTANKVTAGVNNVTLSFEVAEFV